MCLSIPPGLGKLRVLVHFLRNAPFSEKPSMEFITFSEGPGKAGAIREKARSLNISRWPCRLPEPLGKLRTRLVLKQVIFIATETFHCDYSHSWESQGSGALVAGWRDPRQEPIPLERSAACNPVGRNRATWTSILQNQLSLGLCLPLLRGVV